MEIRTLSDLYCPKFFSQSVGSLLTLLVKSFEEHRCLIFRRSQLSSLSIGVCSLMVMVCILLMPCLKPEVLVLFFLLCTYSFRLCIQVFDPF